MERPYVRLPAWSCTVRAVSEGVSAEVDFKLAVTSVSEDWPA